MMHALSDPMRLRIVGELASGEERTCKSFDLPIVKSTCTHHFKVLREAGVIRQRIAGTTRINSLRRDDLDSRFPGLLDAVLAGVALAGGGAGEVGAESGADAGRDAGSEVGAEAGAYGSSTYAALVPGT